MGNVAVAANFVGAGACGPTSMCSGSGCSDCRTRCTAVDAMGTSCGRTPPPPRYEFPGIGECTPRNPMDSPSPLSARLHRGGNALVDCGASTPSVAQAPEVNQAHHLVKNFIQSVVKGITVTMLFPSGSPAAEGVVSLDRGLKTMYLKRIGNATDGKRRIVPLEQIRGIIIGDDSLNDDSLPATELCVTLFLEGNAQDQTVTLEFPDLEERDTFALCLSMFVDGRRVEVERRVR